MVFPSACRGSCVCAWSLISADSCFTSRSLLSCSTTFFWREHAASANSLHTGSTALTRSGCSAAPAGPEALHTRTAAGVYSSAPQASSGRNPKNISSGRGVYVFTGAEDNKGTLNLEVMFTRSVTRNDSCFLKRHYCCVSTVALSLRRTEL